MTAQDLPALSIADLQLLLRRREVSPREVIDALRARIEVVDGDIGAYLSLDMDAATNEADKANVDLSLGGIPLAIKDIISVMGQPCTCASKILQGYRATYDATVIRKLRAAGAIPFGKTTCRACRVAPVAGRQQQLPRTLRSVRSAQILVARFGNRPRFRVLSALNRLMDEFRDSVWSLLHPRSIKLGH